MLSFPYSQASQVRSQEELLEETKMLGPKALEEDHEVSDMMRLLQLQARCLPQAIRTVQVQHRWEGRWAKGLSQQWSDSKIWPKHSARALVSKLQ